MLESSLLSFYFQYLVVNWNGTILKLNLLICSCCHHSHVAHDHSEEYFAVNTRYMWFPPYKLNISVLRHCEITVRHYVIFNTWIFVGAWNEVLNNIKWWSELIFINYSSQSPSGVHRKSPVMSHQYALPLVQLIGLISGNLLNSVGNYLWLCYQEDTHIDYRLLCGLLNVLVE